MSKIVKVIDIGNLELNRSDNLVRLAAGLENKEGEGGANERHSLAAFAATGKLITNEAGPARWTREFAATGKPGKAIGKKI